MIQTCRTYKVDPDRLEPGRWSHEFNQQIGEGDITGSYCADAIALYGTTRKPFVFRGDIWATTSRFDGMAKAYRLVPIDAFNEASMTFSDKTQDCEEARADPDGFYHGVAVSFRKDWFVLHGPPAVFVPGQVVQPGLFDLSLIH